MIMSKLFEDLCEGLQEAIDFEKGSSKAKVTTYVIAPVKEYSNHEIRDIRNNAGMTQSVFANYMGVSKKTVEAWECGRSHPTGPANRLLTILESGRSEELGIISIV